MKNDIRQTKTAFAYEQLLDEAMDAMQKSEFKRRLRDGVVEFEYMKKDGTKRFARGTMNPEIMGLPQTTQRAVDSSERSQIARRHLPEDSVFYYDLGSNGFRSFKMSNFIGYSNSSLNEVELDDDGRIDFEYYGRDLETGFDNAGTMVFIYDLMREALRSGMSLQRLKECIDYAVEDAAGKPFMKDDMNELADEAFKSLH